MLFDNGPVGLAVSYGHRPCNGALPPVWSSVYIDLHSEVGAQKMYRKKKILFIVTPCSIQHFPCLFVVCDLFSSIWRQTTSSPLVYHGSSGNVTACLFLPVICDYILIPSVLLLEDEHKTKCHSVIDYYAPVYFLYSEPIELKWEINLHSSVQWTIFWDDLFKKSVHFTFCISKSGNQSEGYLLVTARL